MDANTKIRLVESMTDEHDHVLIRAYLDLAGEKVCRQAYPYDESKTDVPLCYSGNQIAIAAYLLNKRGAEGETSHSENGTMRTYEDADIPASMLRDVLPMVRVIGGGASE